MGNKKYWDIIVEKRGEKGARQYQAEIGARGGRAKNPNKGFGSDHQRAVLAGRKSKIGSKSSG